MNHTQGEVCRLMNISEKTLLKNVKEIYQVKSYKEVSERFFEGTKLNLKRKAWNHVEDGNIPMTIFLMKNWLGYTDKIEQKQEVNLSNDKLSQAIDNFTKENLKDE